MVHMPGLPTETLRMMWTEVRTLQQRGIKRLDRSFESSGSPLSTAPTLSSTQLKHYYLPIHLPHDEHH